MSREIFTLVFLDQFHLFKQIKKVRLSGNPCQWTGSEKGIVYIKDPISF